MVGTKRLLQPSDQQPALVGRAKRARVPKARMDYETMGDEERRMLQQVRTTLVDNPVM